MAQNSVKVTYELLYECLRREQDKGELQKLDPAFWSDVASYLAEKQAQVLATMHKDDMFSVQEREKVMTQVRNARTIIKNLFDKREGKIVQTALNKSRTNSPIVQEPNLLEEEKQVFHAILGVMAQFRREALSPILEGTQPQTFEIPKPSDVMAFNMPKPETKSPFVMPAQMPPRPQPMHSPPPSAPAQPVAPKPAVSAPVNPSPVPPATIAPTPAFTKPSTPSPELAVPAVSAAPPIQTASTSVSVTPGIKVKFVAQVPKFVGKELEVYGPYEKEQVTSLPSEIANILITNGSAIPA